MESSLFFFNAILVSHEMVLATKFVFLYHVAHGIHLSFFELQHFETACYASFCMGHEIVFYISMF